MSGKMFIASSTISAGATNPNPRNREAGALEPVLTALSSRPRERPASRTADSGPRNRPRPESKSSRKELLTRTSARLRLLQDLLMLLSERDQRRFGRRLAVERLTQALCRGGDQLVVRRHVPEVLDHVERLGERRVVGARLPELLTLQDLLVGGEA